MNCFLPGIRKWIFPLLVSLCLGAQAQGCGISWSEPRSFFEDVDYQGHVHVIEKIGELETSKLKLPIYLIFNSGNGYASLYSGLFEVPLLQARIEQVEEDTWLLRSPSGWLLPFRRNKEIRTILDGSSGMKAEINEEKDTITAWAQCGDKIVFFKGRIIHLQIKETKLDYIYTDDRLSEICESGKVLLKVNFDPGAKETTGFSLGADQTIQLEWGEKPFVQSVNGTPTVIAQQKALTKVILPDGTEKNFEFGVSEQTWPTLKMNNKKEMTWNPETRLAHKINEWVYNIKPGKERFANAAIERTNRQGETEFWHYDGAKGKEIVQGTDGVEKMRTWFTRGKLAGATRKRQVTIGNQTKTVYQASYDEQSRLMRTISEDGSIAHIEYLQDSQGNSRLIRSSDGRTRQEYYDEKGREIKILINGTLHCEKFYAPDGSWEKRVVYDKGSKSPSRTFYREFDKRGREVFDKITEHSGEYPEVTRRYFYDAAGRLEKQVDSQQGTILYAVGPNGLQVATTIKDDIKSKK